jgi:hypothetical protein
MTAAAIAGLDTLSARQLLADIFPRSLERLNDDFSRAENMLRQSPLNVNNYAEALNIMKYARIREEKVIRSLPGILSEDSAVRETAQRYLDEIKKTTDANRAFLEDEYRRLCRIHGTAVNGIELSQEEKAADLLIPHRNPDFPGPVFEDYFSYKLKQESIEFDNPFNSLQLYEIGAFIDGNRSVLDIRNAVSAECGPVKLSDVLHYLEILEAIDLVSFTTQDRTEI